MLDWIKLFASEGEGDPGKQEAALLDPSLDGVRVGWAAVHGLELLIFSCIS